MLLFLAAVLEQLDLALEHITKDNIHDSRFGMMLTDNALELMLHQIAKDKVSDLQMWSFKREAYSHQDSLGQALGRNFDAKVKFAKVEAGLSEEDARTITIMHGYRNEVYHIGLAHRSILPALSRFYFDTTCAFLGTYKSRGLSWGSNLKLPERSAKYFHGNSSFPGRFEDFGNACTTLRTESGYDSNHTIAALADEMDAIIDHQDTCIDIVAQGVYDGQQTTRDRAVVDTQAWRLAFSEEGTKFAASKGYSGHVLKLPDWLRDHYHFKYRSDPISSWRKRAKTLRTGNNPHAALSTYQSFITSTLDIREAIDDAAAGVEREIDRLIDMKRGK